MLTLVVTSFWICSYLFFEFALVLVLYRLYVTVDLMDISGGGVGQSSSQIFPPVTNAIPHQPKRHVEFFRKQR